MIECPRRREIENGDGMLIELLNCPVELNEAKIRKTGFQPTYRTTLYLSSLSFSSTVPPPSMENVSIFGNSCSGRGR